MAHILDFSQSTIRRFSHAAPAIVIHFAGDTFTHLLADLDIGRVSSDNQIKAAAATALMVAIDQLDDYLIERHSNGSLVVRPLAVSPALGVWDRGELTATGTTR